jgi:hypothetical protein
VGRILEREFAVGKNFTIWEKVKLQLRTDMFKRSKQSEFTPAYDQH